MPFHFPSVTPRQDARPAEWNDWLWQFRKSLKTREDFERYFILSPEEREGFAAAENIFRVQTTPYYASLAARENPHDPIRQMILPLAREAAPTGAQQMLDPLGERQARNRPAARLVHRYSDRVLFLLTDLCTTYCRYCTRKHFTAGDHAVVNSREYDEALSYLNQIQMDREDSAAARKADSLRDRIMREKLRNAARARERQTTPPGSAP